MKPKLPDGEIEAPFLVAPPDETHFRGVILSKSERAQSVVSEAHLLVSNYEKHFQLRKRSRTQAALTIFKKQIDALLSEMTCAELRSPGRGLIIPLTNRVLGKKDRYRPKILSQTLPEVIRVLATPEMDYITVEKGRENPFVPNKGVGTVIKAGWRLKDRIDEHNLTIDDFGQDLDQEVVVLKDSKQGLFEKGKRLEYRDTEKTLSDRKKLRKINSWLDSADVAIMSQTGQPLTAVNERLLKRVFNNGQFDQGGRLFGGFWQNMKKEARLDQILIDGMDIVELDYSQAAVMIMYGLVGVNPSFEDAYLLPGLEHNREGVKKVLNAMTQSPKPLQRFPAGTRSMFDGHRMLAVTQLTDLIMKHHSPIAHLFYANKGLYFMYLESEIMLEVLTRLVDMKVTALPIHDAVLVAEKHEGLAREVMVNSFQELTGVRAKVTSDGL
jgi:hypothetical protein